MDKKKKELAVFPPVVTVLGHVDHGKTSLLDAIRKTDIAAREHGGITQGIGASQIEISHDGKKRAITFIDTPGHEAFSKMRSRGAQVADIGLLIVAATDGVMPQTRESIEVLKASGLPFIVVLTKSDLPDKNVERVKQQLLKEEVMIEGYGGDIPVIEVSARNGTNVKELLDLILLVQEMQAHAPSGAEQGKSNASISGVLKAIVIESKLDQKSGPRATVVIKNGTMSARDDLVSEAVPARVRTLIDTKGARVKSATVGEAVEVLGFEKVPSVGSIVYRKGDAELIQSVEQEPVIDLPYSPQKKAGRVSLVLVTDTLGSLEAIVNALPEGVDILAKKTGELSEADVLMAKSTGALGIGFNTKIRPDIAKFAQTEKVLFKNYTIIYELIDEIKDVLEGKQLALEEKVFGVAQVLARFPFDKTHVLGVKVLEGRIAKGDKVRVMRNDTSVGETSLQSLRQGKNTISKIEEGNEAGVILAPFLDFTIGDVIICHG